MKKIGITVFAFMLIFAFVSCEAETPAPEVVKYTVTFDSAGGSAVAPIEVESGKVVAAPEEPEKSGYTFLEWRIGDEKYDFASAVTKDITLKAAWKWNGIEVSDEAGLRDAVLKEGAKILITADFSLSSVLPIEKPVSIDGNGKKISVAFNEAENDATSFYILSSGVTVKNLILESSTDGKRDHAFFWIATSGTEEAPIVIENCTMDGNPSGPFTNSVVGILTSSGDNGNYLTVRNNTIKNTKHGMYFNNIGNAVIEGNTIDTTRYNGINIAAGSKTEIKANIIKNYAKDYTEGLDVRYSKGIYVDESATDVTVAESNSVVPADA